MARSTKKKSKSRKPPVTLATPTAARPAKPLFRLIPMTIFVASGLLVLKSIEIYQTGRDLRDELFVSTVIAQDEAKPAAPETAAETAKTEAETPAETDEAKAAPEQDKQEAKKTEAPAEKPPVDIFESRDKGFNQRELDVLKSLSERREELDKLEQELALREKVLKATEERIDKKIGELNTMSAELKELLVTYDKEEDAKISSLVKVYEAMKPKDAARIFEEMDMDILLMVVDRMNERRVAPVLAEMSPEKAKDLTQQLADQKRIRPKPEAALEEVPYSPPLF